MKKIYYANKKLLLLHNCICGIIILTLVGFALSHLSIYMIFMIFATITLYLPLCIRQFSTAYTLTEQGLQVTKYVGSNQKCLFWKDIVTIECISFLFINNMRITSSIHGTIGINSEILHYQDAWKDVINMCKKNNIHPYIDNESFERLKKLNIL